MNDNYDWNAFVLDRIDELQQHVEDDIEKDASLFFASNIAAASLASVSE
jgi:hypothetical protein